MSKSSFKTNKDPGSFCMKVSGFIIMLLLAVFLLPADVSANSGGYTTPSFDVNVVTDEDHVFHVTEEIHVDFDQYRHGIYRYIPDGERYYGVKNIRVAGYTYETYSESGNTVIQIGDPDYTVYGPQTYRITYDIVGYKDDSAEEDYLSLDLLPTGWSTPIESASLRIEFPEEIDDIETYVGAYGSDDMTGYFDISSKGDVYTAVSTQEIPRGVGLTIRATLPEGYWVDPYSRDDSLMLLYGILAVMGMLMLLLWLFVGRDDPIISTVEFYPPEEMDPLQIAYVANDEVKSEDIPALFMYMADKGYVDIQQEGKKDFSLICRGETPLSESYHVRQIYSSLFPGNRKKVRLNALPDDFGEVVAESFSDVKDAMEERQPSFSTASKAGRVVGLIFCLIIPLAAFLMHSWLTYWSSTGGFTGFALAVLMFVCMIFVVGGTDSFRTKKHPVRIIIGFIIFLAAMFAEAVLIAMDYPLLAVTFMCSALAAAVATIFVRRRMNNELFGKVLGFREFIRTAEYDRLKMLSEENPSYFFNIMPYACVFGMSTKWADKFSNFKIPAPQWYQSSGGVWDPYFYHYMYVHTGHNISQAVSDYHKAVGAGMLSSAVDSVSSGGFSGGGFSGGGFGGGGGGSW